MLLYNMITDLVMVLHRLSQNRCEKMVFSLNLNKLSGLWSCNLGFIGVSRRKPRISQLGIWAKRPWPILRIWKSDWPILRPSHTGIGVLTPTNDGSSSVHRYTPIHIAFVSFLCVWYVDPGIRWCVCVEEKMEIQVVFVWYCFCIEDICSIRLHTYVYIIVHQN